MRYDAMRRVTGTISPDPDGAGTLPFRAVRNSYDGAGRLTRVETRVHAGLAVGDRSRRRAGAISPSACRRDIIYDAAGRKIREMLISITTGGVAFGPDRHPIWL